VRVLADTHLLLWAAAEPAKLSPRAATVLTDPSNEVRFSAASIWEVTIKTALANRPDFQVDAIELVAGLRSHGWTELPITAAHAAQVRLLPNLHRDPFDRILVAQAQIEHLTLLTHDGVVARYPGSIELV
jgi:PIN domain nuclease of toxin-antitoxin system